MKILLDPQIFNQQTYGGISRYYTEVFSILNKRDDVEVMLPIYGTENYYLQSTNLLAKNKFLTSLYKVLDFFKISSKTFKQKKDNQLLEQICKENNFDLFVPTYYDPYFLNLINEKPFVLTIYDMIHELLPQYFEGDPYNVKQFKAMLIDKASKIIAVSHNTKKDILKIFPGINPDKIVVIHHGSSIKIERNTKVNLPSNYILFVGSRANYKNFKLLVNSVSEILKEDSSLILLAAGGGEFTEEEINFIDNNGLKKQIIQKDFKENELGHFYQNAQCFVFPSRYEGFGIPVLESMACGCPIILSDSSSFPEVAGEAGIYFDNNSEKDLKQKIQLVLSDENLRKRHSQKGLEQVKKFDWNVAAEQCLKVYKDSMNISSHNKL